MALEAHDLSAWRGLTLVDRVVEGARNEVWRARIGARDVSVRQSRRSPESLAWELDVIEFLADAGFSVADVVETEDGRRHADGVVVPRWLHGVQPSTSDEWHRVVDTLKAVHEVGRGYLQRPGCCTALELAEKRRSADADLDRVPADVETTAIGVFASFEDEPTSLIHGDPDESNLRVLADGSIGLLDFDESRVATRSDEPRRAGRRQCSPCDGYAAQPRMGGCQRMGRRTRLRETPLRPASRKPLAQQ